MKELRKLLHHFLCFAFANATEFDEQSLSLDELQKKADEFSELTE